MERLKHNNILSGSMKEYKFKASSWESCGDHNEGGMMDLLGAGFSWPPRNYTCSFCKREFKSAQALGGHMNVHRRDRARLRQFSPSTYLGDQFSTYTNDHNDDDNNGKFPTLNLNLDSYPNLNSNPSLCLSSGPTKIPHISSTLSPLFTAPNPTATITTTIQCPLAYGKEMKKEKDHVVPINNFGVNTGLMKMKDRKGIFGVEKIVQENGCEFNAKKAEYVRLELEMGLISHECKELDLELRLG